jgi:hypothetical protein
MKQSSKTKHSNSGGSSKRTIIAVALIIGIAIFATTLVALHKPNSGSGSGGAQDQFATLKDVRQAIRDDVKKMLETLPAFRSHSSSESHNPSNKIDPGFEGMHDTPPPSQSQPSSTLNANSHGVVPNRIIPPHGAAPDPHYEPEPTKEPLPCRKSFEPTCDMYPYVRFWNKEFRNADCHKSPLSHPLGQPARMSKLISCLFVKGDIHNK